MKTNDMNILRLKPAKCNTWLIIDGDKSLLIDAGYTGKMNDFEHTIVENGLKPRDIKMIIMTHTHYDHTCRLKEIKEITHARVVVNNQEADFLRKGYSPIPKGTMWYSSVLSWLGRNLLYGMGKFTPVNPDIITSERLNLEKYGLPGYILHTPGHTLGSQCYISGDYAFIGDTLFNIFRNTVFPPFADDVNQLKKSWQSLLETGCKEFYPGHGEVIGVERLKEEADKRVSE